MPKINETVVSEKEMVVSLVEDVALRHEPNQQNVRNNRGFALHKDQVVEVVRRGPKQTRVRYSLVANGESTLVPTEELRGYVHPNLKG